MFRLTKTPSQESDVFRSTDSSVTHHVLDLYFEDNKKSLGAILSSLPEVGLKRKLSSDMRDLQSLDVPNKILKKGLCCGLEQRFLLHILKNCKLFYSSLFIGVNKTFPTGIGIIFCTLLCLFLL